MDSDEDGNYGYDIPDNDGPGFRLSSSHVLGGDFSSIDEEDMRTGNSSEDSDGSSDGSGGGTGSFAYGAYASRKRKKSKLSEKEKSLYGVFYDCSEDENGKGGRSKKARHFDERQNRLAGLSFVKASSSTEVDKNKECKENDDANEAKREGSLGSDSTRESPALLQEKINASALASNTHSSNEKSDAGIKKRPNEDKEGVLNEVDTNLILSRENRFKELLKRANKSKISYSMPTSRREKRPADSKQENSARGFQRSDGGSKARSLGMKTGDALHPKEGDKDEWSRASNEIEQVSTDPSHKRIKEISDTDQVTNDKFSTSCEEENSRIGLQQGAKNRLSNSGPFSSYSSSELRLGISTGANFPPLSETMGMGMGPIGTGVGASRSTKNRDPTIGAFEKHTKGIGMKLLQKMGYGGSGGLGAKRQRRVAGESASAVSYNGSSKIVDEKGLGFESSHAISLSAASKTNNIDKEIGVKRGISRPVEVKVRPTGLGLGYGNFKEASQLKVNRQIEAEVRGINQSTPESQQIEISADHKIFAGIPKSLLSSTKNIMSSGNDHWRREKRKEKSKRKIVNYQEIIDRSSGERSEKMSIIDMRGPSSSIASIRVPHSQSSSDVPLGEELLHNTALLLNSHENQLRMLSYTLKRAKQNITHLQEEGKEIAKRQQDVKDRIAKMKVAFNVIGETESLAGKLKLMNEEGKDKKFDPLDYAMKSVQKLICTLLTGFSKDERTFLKIGTTLIPSITRPIIDVLVSALNPLETDITWFDHLSIGIERICGSFETENESFDFRRTIFMKVIVPWVKSSLITSKWNPLKHVKTGVSLHAALVTSLHNSFSGKSDLQREEKIVLSEAINDEIIQSVVLPKLSRAVSHWKPEFDDKNRIRNPMHLWILPWLPQLSNESIPPNLFHNIQRKIKITISFLSKSEPNDLKFVRSCIDVIIPWKSLLKSSSFYCLSSDSVTTRLARSLARIKIDICTTQNLEQIDALFEYFDQGLMCDDDFLSLIEGEILPVWANSLHSLLKQGSHSMVEFKSFYVFWKKKLLMPQPIVRSDALVCRYFFGGLEMIKAAFESNNEMLDKLVPPDAAGMNYHISLLLRKKMKKKHDQTETTSERNKSAQKVFRDHDIAMLREIVAEFAKHHGISFHPKTGSNATKDGKQVFIFGGHSIYFDKNILFALRGAAWQPISLEHLAQIC